MYHPNKILINNVYPINNNPNLSTTKKKVVIVGSESETRPGLEYVINNSSNFSIIGEVEYYDKAVNKIIKNLPDIIVIDIDKDLHRGIGVLKQIKRFFSQVEILVISNSSDRYIVLDALKAGASGFLLKPTHFKTLIDSLEELACGGAPLSSRIARLLVNELKINLNSPLTVREDEIMQMMVRGIPKSEIARRLSISIETTKTHFRNIYKKLKVNSKSEAIEYALREKLVQNI